MITTTSRISGSSRVDAASLIASRKRKLSELYCVARSSDPLKALNDSTSYSNELLKFLELNDLEKGRLFKESSLPIQHASNSRPVSNGQVLSSTSVATSPSNQENLRPRNKPRNDSQQLVYSKASSPAAGLYEPTADSEKAEVNSRTTSEKGGEHGTSPRASSISPGLQNAVKSSRTGGQVNTSQTSTRTFDDELPQKDWERSRILTGVESPPGSPGVDQRQLEPQRNTGLSQSSDDATGSISHRQNGDRTPSSINTLGLPSSRPEGIHITSPSSHHNLPTPISTSGTVTNHKHHDPASPSSTIGPYSTHTPNVNTVSSDTSPDNDTQLGELESFDRQEARFGENALRAVDGLESVSENVDSSIDAQLSTEQKRAKVDAGDVTTEKDVSEEQPVEDGDGHGHGKDTVVGKASTQTASKEAQSTPGHSQHVDQALSSTTANAQDRISGSSVARRRPKEGLEELRIPRYSSPEDLSKVEENTTVSSVTRSSTTNKATVASTIRSPPERMTTRVSSGALRHKSVSEILGVTERTPSSTTVDRSGDVEMTDSQIPSSPAIPSDTIEPSSLARLLQEERNNQSRSKKPSIVFGSQQQDGSVKSRKAKPQQEKDYLLTLFNSQASHGPNSTSLNVLLASAPKTLTTANHYVDLHEQQDCKLLKKIYQFQYNDRWALRQRERCAEPPRQATQWDNLLSQMKWMQTDFKEEKKWKITVAKTMADACAAYVNQSQDRSTLQVRVKRRLDGEHSDRPHSTPELLASAEDGSISDAFDDESTPDLHFNAAPAAIFSLSLDKVTFEMEKTSFSEQLLSELPLYEPPGFNPDVHYLPDSTWELPTIPVSRFSTGKIEIDETGPPHKRCRYDFDGEAGESEADFIPPLEDDVALFKPESKHILDRIHAGHAFRPPSEFPMPTQAFFEARNSSQWTANEDDDLRALVKEYHYNWSLISTLLTPSTLYTSGAERRTPWECFERWIGLEGLPAEMQKTAYFRTYSTRLANAQKIVSDQQQQLSQQAQSSTPTTPVRRQRTIQPVRVERRKNTKHLAIIDAMRKLAKKRESALQKQQHAAGLQAMRKANETSQPRGPISTPQDFSRLKHERELKIQERQEAYRQSILASQRAALQQRSSQQPPQANPLANGTSNGGMGQSRPQSNGAINGASPTAASSIPNNSVLSSQVRQNLPPAIPTGLPMTGNMPVGPNDQMSGGNFKGIPQAPMQNPGIGQAGMHPSTPNQLQLDHARMQYDQRRLLDQQRQQRQQQQLQQQHQQQQGLQGLQNQGQQGLQGQNQQGLNRSQGGPNSSSPNMNGMNGMGRQATMQQGNALMQALHSASNPNGMAGIGNDFGGFPAGPGVSPRMSQPHAMGPNQPQQLSNGMIPQVNTISHHIKAQFPNMSPDQVHRIAGEQLLRQHQMSQSAMNAAAGAAGSTTQAAMMNSNALMGNQQLYAQMLRAHQASQSRGSSSGSNGARPPSRSATPQNHRGDGSQLSSSQGQNQGQSHNQSPRPPPAQMTAGQ